MPASEYVSASAGSLKLKGVNPSSKVSKSHRKKRPKPETLPASSTPSAEKLEDSAVLDRNDHLQDSAETVEKDGLAADRQLEKLGDDARPDEDEQGLVHLPKTEAELRHEERRRKRLNERLKREGSKTHKERVEELNRYLSNLSEHHDIPRIGPG